MNRHDGQSIIITGAGRGLGRAYAERLASEGARVGIAEIDPIRGEEAAVAIRNAGGDATFFATDVSSPDSAEAMAGFFISRWDRIDGLVANAAIADSVGGATYREIDVDEWDRLMAVNVRGTWLSCRAVAPHMEGRGSGSIVTIGSDTAMWGSPRLLHYVSSKGAVMAFTRALARELGGAGVRVNCVAPGLVRNEATAGVPEDKYAWNIANRALGRESAEADVVGTVSFLLSDDAAFITGQTIVVDGGLVLH